MTLAASILLGFPLGLWLMFRRRTQVIFGPHVGWFPGPHPAPAPVRAGRRLMTHRRYRDRFMFLAFADSKNGTIVTLLALRDSTDGGTAVSWD